MKTILVFVSRAKPSFKSEICSADLGKKLKTKLLSEHTP